MGHGHQQQLKNAPENSESAEDLEQAAEKAAKPRKSTKGQREHYRRRKENERKLEEACEHDRSQDKQKSGENSDGEKEKGGEKGDDEDPRDQVESTRVKLEYLRSLVCRPNLDLTDAYPFVKVVAKVSRLGDLALRHMAEEAIEEFEGHLREHIKRRVECLEVAKQSVQQGIVSTYCDYIEIKSQVDLKFLERTGLAADAHDELKMALALYSLVRTQGVDDEMHTAPNRREPRWLDDSDGGDKVEVEDEEDRKRLKHKRELLRLCVKLLIEDISTGIQIGANVLKTVGGTLVFTGMGAPAGAAVGLTGSVLSAATSLLTIGVNLFSSKQLDKLDQLGDQELDDLQRMFDDSSLRLIGAARVLQDLRGRKLPSKAEIETLGYVREGGATLWDFTANAVDWTHFIVEEVMKTCTSQADALEQAAVALNFTAIAAEAVGLVGGWINVGISVKNLIQHRVRLGELREKLEAQGGGEKSHDAH